jgi:chemotaxis methyl-accepting protein methylase
LTLGPWLHWRLRDQASRSTQHAFTCFYRAPTQLAALTGPVLQHLGLGTVQASSARRRLRVLLYACSNGAEAYTWSAWLAALRPDLDVLIEASDLQPALVERARRGRYTWEEITQHQAVPAWFMDEVFDRDGDDFVVNERTRDRVRFSCADIVHDDLRGRFGQADIVLAQNVLFHLPAEAARQAFGNVLRTLAPAGALFIEGMDQDLRVSLTLANGLQPLIWRNREIYEESRRLIPVRWWQAYYGAEPWLPFRRHRLRRYGTIFLSERQPGAVPQQALAA